LSARDAGGGFINALPYFLLVGLVIGTGFLQARQSQRNSPNMNSQMAMVTKVLPIGFGLFSITFPAGLVLYYFVSNLWRLGQQELIMRKITRPGMKELDKQKGGAIDAKSKDRGTVAIEDAPEDTKRGGLRKLFQLPAAATDSDSDSDAPAATNGSGNGNGTAPKGTNGARAGASSKPVSPGAQRRKTNKRKKKR
jgi:membrane protein insertase Oxa1/YidC/SpoIIIJ